MTKELTRKFILIVAPLTILIAGGILLFFQDVGIWSFFAKLIIFLMVVSVGVIWGLEKKYGVRKAKMILATTAVLGVFSVGTLIIGEMLVRYSYGDVTTTGDNSSYFAQRWRQTTPPISNPWGFRERNVSIPKPEGIYRIAVVGDSFTYGQGIIENARFTNLIEDRLNQNGGQYEVLNFGRPGAETIDHLNIVDNFVTRISPDYVLLQWFINDVEGHDKTGRPSPYRLLPSEFLTEFLHKRSALYYLINNQWGAIQVFLGFTDSYNDYMVERFSDPLGQDARAAKDSLKELFQHLRLQNIPFGVVIFPSMNFVEGLGENQPLSFLIERVLDSCRQESVPCLDLRSVFAYVAPASKLWANRLDSHPGPLANQLAAEAILEKFGNKWKFERR